MITRDTLLGLVLKAVDSAKIQIPKGLGDKIQIEYPDASLGDYSTNAALILAKHAKIKPLDVAQQIIQNLSPDYFDKVEVAGPGFINFYLKKDILLGETQILAEQGLVKHPAKDGKILLEYFQPNIAKPLHVGHLRTAMIGDCLKRMMMFLGYKVESDTHMGDWGTQFGLLLLAYKKYGDPKAVAQNPILELNNLYIRINKETEQDEKVKETGKEEFVKLEKGDKENRKIWQQFVDWSMEKFMAINDLMDILPFDHHWPESFYEDKMPQILEELKKKGLLKESQGAQIVDLQEQGLGVAVIVKSDGGTTYLLRDLATFIYRKSLGFEKQLYVVDNRQAHAFKQLFAIVTLMNRMDQGEAEHVDYGFIGFKGEVLSTRKGNMVLAEDVIKQAEEKVAQIIKEKNPDLKNKKEVIKSVAKGALKYYDFSHNRKSDYDFDWDEALDFNGNSGPYLQYVFARMSSILSKEKSTSKPSVEVEVSNTERQIMMELTKFSDMIENALQDYQPNVLANYLYSLATLLNKFYHESPVIKEEDLIKKEFRIVLIKAVLNVYGKGLDLLGIKPLNEM